MLQENLLKIYETSFRENREMSALTDYFKGETFSYYEMAKEIAKIHLLSRKPGSSKATKSHSSAATTHAGASPTWEPSPTEQ